VGVVARSVAGFDGGFQGMGHPGEIKSKTGVGLRYEARRVDKLAQTF